MSQTIALGFTDEQGNAAVMCAACAENGHLRRDAAGATVTWTVDDAADYDLEPIAVDELDTVALGTTCATCGEEVAL